MQIRVNGKAIELDGSLSLADLLQRYNISPSTGGVAVAFNESIAFRQKWNSQMIKEGDRIEIIHAVQGG